MNFNPETLLAEVTYKAVRSSGSGGQHVNKVSSKVELMFDVAQSAVLSEAQKELLKTNLQSRLTKEGVLLMQCGESRSQHRNKMLVNERFLRLIEQRLIVPKKRKPTKIPKSVIRKRLKAKKIHSDKKANRRRVDFD